jgi:hypothetical protein
MIFMTTDFLDIRATIPVKQIMARGWRGTGETLVKTAK